MPTPAARKSARKPRSTARVLPSGAVQKEDARREAAAPRTIARNGIRVPVHSTEAVDPGRIALPAADSPTGEGTLSVRSPKRAHDARIYIGDCRDTLKNLPEVQSSTLDLVFADPPFNWNRGYDKWNDSMREDEYLAFTFEWLDLCITGLRPGGALWVNIPDDWAAEIVCYLKGRMTDPRTHAPRRPPAPMHMENWCIWHYRFGQNATERFINSKVHALYFVKAESGSQKRFWNPRDILELSDRAAIYEDARTLSKKDGMPPSMRVPMDVWYGRFFGRVQGNNKERRHYHDNQLPEAYLERVVASCSKRGDLVLDPFLGSGTTGVIAHAMDRRFIGCEFSPENARNAAARITDGPVRSIGSTRGQSSAIFPHRRKGRH